MECGDVAKLKHVTLKADGVDDAPTVSLAPRERDTVRLLAQGRKLREAAEELGITVKTIDKYIASAKAKTGARTSEHMVAIAVTKGLL